MAFVTNENVETRSIPLVESLATVGMNPMRNDTALHTTRPTVLCCSSARTRGPKSNPDIGRCLPSSPTVHRCAF